MGKQEKDTRPVMDAYASTDCPQCGGFVPLRGQGREGEMVRLTGTFPNRHVVYYDHQA